MWQRSQGQLRGNHEEDSDWVRCSTSPQCGYARWVRIWALSPVRPLKSHPTLLYFEIGSDIVM